MINNILTTDGFYFCTDFDLTHTLQRLANTSPDFQEMSLLERVKHVFNFTQTLTHQWGYESFLCNNGSFLKVVVLETSTCLEVRNVSDIDLIFGGPPF